MSDHIEKSGECLIGRLVYAGDLTVNGETVSGVMVEISRETLAAQPIPMYQRMAVVPAELLNGWTVKYEDWKRLADAAGWLARACKDRLPVGHFAKLDQEYSAVRKILSATRNHSPEPAKTTDPNPKVTESDRAAARSFAGFLLGYAWNEYALNQLAIEFAAHREKSQG